MTFGDNLVADRHAHTRTFAHWLRRKERIENLLLHGFRHTGAVVRDRNLNPLSIQHRGTHRDLPGLWFRTFFSLLLLVCIFQNTLMMAKTWETVNQVSKQWRFHCRDGVMYIVKVAKLYPVLAGEPILSEIANLVTQQEAS